MNNTDVTRKGSRRAMALGCSEARVLNTGGHEAVERVGWYTTGWKFYPSILERSPETDQHRLRGLPDSRECHM